MINNKIELLAPAGDKERAYYALNYGADAIFIGAKIFSLRARASNFEIEDITEVVQYAHKKNKKVYLVTNVICHNFLAKDFISFMTKISKLNIDGFICADPFIIKTINDQFPECEIHISTQQSITNSKAALFWKKFNATRVVLARELTFDEIKDTTENLRDKMEIEVFIHGAVCISYSGRCMMSNSFSGRDSNVGGCAQSCRWIYNTPCEENKHPFTMSAKDMSYINHLDKLLTLNIASFKIEGRMKSLNYITTVVKNYRIYMDEYYNKKEPENKLFFNNLLQIANREFDDAFLINQNSSKMLYHDIEKNVNQNYLFIIKNKLNDFTYEIITKNYMDSSMKMCLLTPNNYYKINIESILDLDNKRIDITPTPMTKLVIKIKQNIIDWKYAIGKKDEL